VSDCRPSFWHFNQTNDDRLLCPTRYGSFFPASQRKDAEKHRTGDGVLAPLVRRGRSRNRDYFSANIPASQTEAGDDTRLNNPGEREHPSQSPRRRPYIRRKIPLSHLERAPERGLLALLPIQSRERGTGEPDQKPRLATPPHLTPIAVAPKRVIAPPLLSRPPPRRHPPRSQDAGQHLPLSSSLASSWLFFRPGLSVLNWGGDNDDDDLDGKAIASPVAYRIGRRRNSFCSPLQLLLSPTRHRRVGEEEEEEDKTREKERPGFDERLRGALARGRRRGIRARPPWLGRRQRQDNKLRGKKGQNSR